MQDNTLWILVGIVAVLGLVMWLVARRRNTAVLREHFGDEYDRTVEARGGVSKADCFVSSPWNGEETRS